MADIQKIKLGNSIYNIKDQIARNGFATAGLEVLDPPSGSQQTEPRSVITFYDGTGNDKQLLGSVPMDILQIPYIINTAIVSHQYQIDNTLAGVTDSTIISVGKENGSPVILFNSTTNGAIDGTATTVKLPVGANGTIALLSDISTAAGDKIGWAALNTVSATSSEVDYNKIDLFVNQADATPKVTISLKDLKTSTISTKALKFSSPSSQDQLTPNPNNTSITITSPGFQVAGKYVFTMGPSSGVNSTISLPMKESNGTIALVSDVEAAVDAVQSEVDNINSVLGLDQESVTAAIDTFNEVKDFLEDYENSDSLAALLSDLSSDVEDCVKKTDIVDNLTTNDATKVLSAKQGKALKDALDTLNGSAVKNVSVNGKTYSPSSGTVTLSNTVTKIQLNGKDQTLTPTASSGEGKVNLNNIVTKINFNGTSVSPVTDSSTGDGVVTLTESDPVFLASPAHGISSSDITKWNGALADVQFNTSGSGNSTKYLLQKKGVTASSYTSFVELPTMVYLDNQETLEFVFAKTYSAS